MMLRLISIGFLGQGVGMVCSIISMPLAIRFLGQHSYGIWITILTLANWLSSCDLGLGNSLRNQLAKSFAAKDRTQSLALMSTGYTTLLLTSCILLAPLGLITLFLTEHWHLLPHGEADAIRTSCYAVLPLVCIDIILRLGIILYTADQRAQVAPIAAGMNGILILLAIVALNALYKPIDGRLQTYALIMAAIPPLTNTCVTVCAFLGRFGDIRPQFTRASRPLATSLLKTGLGFFGIQIGMAMTFQITTLITAARATPSDVTGINVAEKIFGVISVASTIALFPYWSRFTAADSLGEHGWILNSVRRLELAMLPVALVTLMALLFYNQITQTWLGDSTIAPLAYAIPIAGKYLLISINSIYCYYLNAINMTTSQLILYLSIAVISIPVCILMHKGFGTAGMLYFIPTALLIMSLTLRNLTFATLRAKMDGFKRQ